MATRLRQMLPEVALSLSWVQLAAVLAALLLATKLVSLVLRRRRLAAATLAVGGGPIPKLPSCDRWLGLDNSLALLRHLRQHTLLPLVEGWFTEQALRLATKEIGETRVKGDRGTEDEKRGSHSVSPAGWTLSVNIFGDESVWTADPDNVRAVLATNAKDWSIGRMRVDAFDPLFGPNIITSDGEAWQASRSIMRPSFARSQINDTERFARYYEHFRRRIPDDGKMTVDLAPLFYMFSMDVSSELLYAGTLP